MGGKVLISLVVCCISILNITGASLSVSFQIKIDNLKLFILNSMIFVNVGLLNSRPAGSLRFYSSTFLLFRLPPSQQLRCGEAPLTEHQRHQGHHGQGGQGQQAGQNRRLEELPGEASEVRLKIFMMDSPYIWTSSPILVI